MRIDSIDIQTFSRINEELRARAYRLFAERMKDNPIKYKIESIEFYDQGSAITYTMEYRSVVTTDVTHFSFEDLQEFNESGCPVSEVIPLHQAYREGGPCAHCGKPWSEWKPMERCHKHVYNVNTLRGD